ncbi:MAG: cytochrome b/b6 domain-containing protein [Actinobacteria bacterium]|nr:cytochrome b/b6 domain-containing protein [Actinomycetota bacterium]
MSRTKKLALWIPLALVVLVAVVLLARWWRETSAGADFLATYPGETELPENAPVGFPWWLNFQHFLNAFFIVLIARTGWLVRTTQRPAAYWIRNNTGLIRTKGTPKKISLDLWLHLSLDALWVINGIVFVALLFVTGQWMRLIPTSWDVLPNAVSAGIQYASLQWPVESGWTNYNSLQQLAYFTIVFVAAPLAIITGLRMSNLWPGPSARISRAYPLAIARAVHLPVMFFFVAFIIVHVTLVLTTGAMRNLNHMYAANDGDGWLGLIFFAVSLVLIVAAWIFAKPAFLQPIASISGKVTRQ